MFDNGLFSVLFENMTSGAAIYEVRNDGLSGRDYIIKDFNKISRDIENVTREEVIGKSLFDLRPTIDEYGLIEVFRQVWKTGEPAKFPSKQYVDENYSRWYENRIFKLPTGEIVAMYSDVTEKELGIIEINKKNKLLNELIENAPYGVFIMDDSGRYKEVNKKACDQTGYTKEELCKMKVMDLLVTDPEGNRDNDFKDLKINGHINVNKEFITKNGEIKRWNLSAVKISEDTFMAQTWDITEEEKLRENIRESAEEYQSLFDNSALGIGYFTPEGKIIWFNKQAAANVGGKPEDFKGKTLYDIFNKKDADNYIKRLKNTLMSGKTISYEDELELPVGKVTFYSTYNCIHNRDGKLLGIQIISQDITELKETEEAIAQSQREYRILFEEAPLGYQSLDINGDFIAVNKVWLEMLGYSMDEVIGHNFSEFLHPGYIPLFNENFPNFKKVGSTCAIFSMRKKNGQFITIRFDGKIVYGDNGEFIKTQCMLQDITYSKEMELKLRESESKFRNMFENAPMGYQMLDEKGVFLDVNQTWLEMFGYEKDKIIGTDIRRLVSPGHDENLNVYINELKLRDRAETELEIIKKNGDKAFVKYYGRSIKDSEGRFLRTMGLVHDITDVKKLELANMGMEAQLRNQQKLESIGILAGGVAHEINNPINGIMNYGQLILDTIGEREEISEYAREIIFESQRISSIVKDLLQFSRQQNQNFQKADIGEIIAHTVSLIRTIMMHDQIDFEVDIEKILPEVTCRSRQIQQVIMNIITNARDTLNDKYEGYNQNKIIKLQCKRIVKADSDWIQLSIKDNGKGIPNSTQESIFDPFFTTKGRNQGTGLGLSISYGIIKDHKGNLYFETEEGESTTFYIELPL